MASYYRSTVGTFTSTTRSEILAQLTLRHAASFAEMRSEVPLTWWDDVDSLQQTLLAVCRGKPEAQYWEILLEFEIPRKSGRIDAVLLAGARIVVLECKASDTGMAARRQLEEYATLLHYFHGGSQRRHLTPILVSHAVCDPEGQTRAWFRARQGELSFESLASCWIAPVRICNWSELGEALLQQPDLGAAQLEAASWDNAPYCPTPTIIEAAQALRTGLSIREIAMSEAAEHDITEVVAKLREIVEQARIQKQHVICFLTGVPGSGKTLIGLSLAHSGNHQADSIHFMSGNGPLVNVLQEVFRRQAMRDRVSAVDAKIRARTLIENVHLFASEYADNDTDRPPSNHVIIFDEAQRAWDLAQNRRKFNRNYSEPEMLLSIMARHEDWACVIALVGGGQEINNGEAGLGEWGKALTESPLSWTVYASPEVVSGGTSTAGHRLFADADQAADLVKIPLLHLRTSNRSLRAEDLAQWVNLVLLGNCDAAAAMNVAARFPLLLTRNLAVARRKLREQALGESRYGLVGSSKAARLRAEGLEPDSNFHGAYPWHHWYLAPPQDIRSSFACEVFATEFEIQGLELDWVGLCWGGDFIWSGSEWRPRRWHQSGIPKWCDIRGEADRQYRRNAYRVLLTRARQGMVIYIPSGAEEDSSRSPLEMDRTANYLIGCGAILLDGPDGRAVAGYEPR